MIKPTVFCDVCNKTKGDVNHWYYAEILLNDIHVYRWPTPTSTGLLGIGDVPMGMNIVHLCGAACVHAKVNEFLSTKLVEKVPA